MDDGRLDRLERALLSRGRNRLSAPLPEDFTARVMDSVRAVSLTNPPRPAFLDAFTQAARRFAPVGAVAAASACGYAQLSERLLHQALLGLSLNGSGLLNITRLLP